MLVYSLQHSVPDMVDQVTCVLDQVEKPTVLFPAPDLHEPVSEPGPPELQRLEAAVHQTPLPVQVCSCSEEGQQQPAGIQEHMKLLLNAPD